MYPVTTEDDPSCSSIVIGDIGLILLIKQTKKCILPGDEPPKIYSFEGDVFIRGKVQSGTMHAVKISEQPEKYF